MPKKLGSSTNAIAALQGADLSGKIAIVTGGNSGIGVETVRALAHAGADVILCSRSEKAGEAVAQEIRTSGVKGTVTVKPLELDDFASITAFADDVKKSTKRLDILALNAGIMACPLMRTKQGFEMQIGVNHIGHFYLTSLLLPKLKASGTSSDPARVVSVSSTAHMFGKINLDDLNYEKRSYSAWGSYGQSKLANILFASELDRRMKEEGVPVNAYSLHPGVIDSNLQRHMGWVAAPFKLFRPFMKSCSQGAATTIVAATASDIPSGSYLSDCQVAKPTVAARDSNMAKALWEHTEALIKAALQK